MKKEILLVGAMVVLLLLLGVSTGVLGVHIVLNSSKAASYWTILLAGSFGVVGGELLKLIIKRMQN